MKTLKEIEREYIIEVLSKSRTLGEAAKTLGLTTRNFQNKRKQYGIENPLETKKHATKQMSVYKNAKAPASEEDYNCMPNLSPEERDYYESRDCLKAHKNVTHKGPYKVKDEV